MAAYQHLDPLAQVMLRLMATGNHTPGPLVRWMEADGWRLVAMGATHDTVWSRRRHAAALEGKAPRPVWIRFAWGAVAADYDVRKSSGMYELSAVHGFTPSGRVTIAPRFPDVLGSRVGMFTPDNQIVCMEPLFGPSTLMTDFLERVPGAKLTHLGEMTQLRDAFAEALDCVSTWCSSACGTPAHPSQNHAVPPAP